ncbi:hypothetical protein [Actinoallomurus sp. NPDC050550]|uniref:hypothetical protein n=1 Tax=Actinoallomurus sp. NPDC050550 TaxID=3154937 RepID=UPI0033F552B8
MVAAFLTGGAITTVMAFALGLVAHDAVITRLGQILVLEIIRLVSALLLGAAMALPFLIAKARGPSPPPTPPPLALIRMGADPDSS